MIFSGFELEDPGTRPLGFSVVREDGWIWDFTVGAFVASPAAGAAVRPVTYLAGADHDTIGQIWADVPSPAVGERCALYFHERADGGPLAGIPVPVQIPYGWEYVLSGAVAIFR